MDIQIVLNESKINMDVLLYNPNKKRRNIHLLYLTWYYWQYIWIQVVFFFFFFQVLQI